MSAEATVRAARQGDLDAFNRLVQDHQAAVYTLAYRVLGDEAAAVAATQAAFVRALRELSAYRSGPFKLFVLRCLVQVCGPLLGRGAAPAAGAFPRLAALPPAQCLALALVDLAGLDYAQAGTVLGVSAAQVRRDLAAARGALVGTLVSAA
jgi:RNA polymerase sigma-70 factor (ECF subfamily)